MGAILGQQQPARQPLLGFMDAVADRPSECRLLLEGWASRYMMLEDGRRQIIALHISGDFLDLHSFPLEQMDHSIGLSPPARLPSSPIRPCGRSLTAIRT